MAVQETEQLRRACSDALLPWWERGTTVPWDRDDLTSASALWRVHAVQVWPVRLARDRGSSWFVERLDDPPVPPSRLDPAIPRYAHPAWYRAEIRDLRLMETLVDAISVPDRQR
jgi:hypothetical protein